LAAFQFNDFLELFSTSKYFSPFLVLPFIGSTFFSAAPQMYGEQK